MHRAIPKANRTSPTKLKARPTRLLIFPVILYGINRNHLGFSDRTTVSMVHPMKNIEPIMIIRYPMVSLCLDSSAFSWR